MITFSKLGNKGNLGNQFFQIASVVGIAQKHRQSYFFPQWKYSSFFENELPVSVKDGSYKYLKESAFDYHEWDIAENANYDLDGWLQTEKYFDVQKTKALFKFKEAFKEATLKKHADLFEKKTILVSVRRGDFVNNPNYFQLSYKFYLLALINNFPDLKDRTIVFTSDDIGYCKFHYSFFKNAVFLENIPPMEQIVLGIHCDDYVISNSTFSWWVAWLGENENKRVYRPIKNLIGEFGRINNDKDFFPERWIAFDENGHRMPWNASYFTLILKGTVYDFFVKTNYFYNVNKNRFKKRIKKIVARE